MVGAGSRFAPAGYMDQHFLDRRQAGRKLGQVLRRFPTADPVVLALPRGGVPVGYEIARLLGAPLEVFIVRKIGLPCCRDVAMGALASGGIQVLDGDLIRTLQVQPYAVDMAIKKEMRELARREERYGAGSAPPVLRGRTAILVDDGLATGLTMRAAVRAARTRQPARIIVAVPVGARKAIRLLETEADEVVCLCTEEPFDAAALCYARFDQITDDEVCALLGGVRARDRLAS
jgi:putative phosphoribosyl transferase